MRDILARAQKYVQIDNATRSSTDYSPKRGVKWKTKGTTCSYEEDSEPGNWTVKKPAWNLAKVYGDEANFTSFKTSVDQVYSAIKDKEFIKRPLPSNTKGQGARVYCAWVIIPQTVVLFGDNSGNW